MKTSRAAGSLDQMLESLKTSTFRGASEAALQSALEGQMLHHGVDYEREVDLGAYGRVDFMVDRAAVEVKTKGTRPSVIAQLFRYSESRRVERLVLITTRSAHLGMPDEIGGKPLEVVWVRPL